MPANAIKKSMVLDSEPVLQWPKFTVRIKSLNGYALSYQPWLDPLRYELHPSKMASVQIAELNFQTLTGWTDCFAEVRMEPFGLMNLANLNDEPDGTKISDWLSVHGPLGLKLDRSSTTGKSRSSPMRDILVPTLCIGDVLIQQYEPIQCILSAARRAANVIALWKALKASYRGLGAKDAVQDIQSIVTFEDTDPNPVVNRPSGYSRAERASRVEKLDHVFRAKVKGEPRSLHPKPTSPHEWRKLASTLLAGYITDHMNDQVRVIVGVRNQNKDEGEQFAEPVPDWNLTPILRVDSALTAYYVELLMVMRRFRVCRTCGRDISHQRDKSKFCSIKSTCRSKQWHRQNAAKKRTR